LNHKKTKSSVDLQPPSHEAGIGQGFE